MRIASNGRTIAQVRLLYGLFCGLLCVLLVGCTIDVSQDKAKKKKKVASAKTKPTVSEPVKYETKDRRPRTVREYSGGGSGRTSGDSSSDSPSGFTRGSGGGGGNFATSQKVMTVIAESAEQGPTLVVWLLDVSESAFAKSTSLGTDIGGLYDRLAAKKVDGGGKASDRLLTAVVGFGNDVTIATADPTNDKAALAAAFETLKSDKTEKEMTFTALQKALDKFLPYRSQKQYQMMFVIVTDEAGDDGDAVDAVIPTLSKFAIPVYALGVTAPFGKVAGGGSIQMGSFLKEQSGMPPAKTRQGPESRQLEMVDIPFMGNNYDGGGGVTDSGFGPFHLEYLCRSTGGAFLATGSSASMGGRGMSVSIDPSVMSKYAPDYVSLAEYRSSVEKNEAKKALLAAAEMPQVEIMASPPLNFPKRNEADLAKIVTEAQKAPAKVQSGILDLHTLLMKGEKDREKLTSPRWQASYDLALGRASAIRARVDGYNAMLAQLKRKSGFKNESSSTWVLVPADTIEVDSTLDKLAQKARALLTRVVTEHPKTPWAALAERELKMPIGWKWEEQ